MNSVPSVVAVGCTWSGAEKIEALLCRGLGIDHLVTMSPEMAEKANVAGYVDFAALGAAHGIPVDVAETYSLTAAPDRSFFEDNGFGVLITGGWQRLIPTEVLDTLDVGALGGHGGVDFLPRGRGRSPLTWSLIEGRRRFIAHLFLMSSGADDGEILDYEFFDINEWDSIRTLYLKHAMALREMTLRTVPRLVTGEMEPLAQVGTPTYYAKRTPDDGHIQWGEWDVFAVHDFVRAQTRPYPGAFTFLRGRKLHLWEAQPFETPLSYYDYGAEYGQVVGMFNDGGEFVVNCLSGLLLVTDWEADIEVRVGEVLGT